MGLRIEDASISRQHAALHVGSRLELEDLESTRAVEAQGPAGMGLRLERMDTALAAQFQRFVPRALGFSLALPTRSSTF